MKGKYLGQMEHQGPRAEGWAVPGMKAGFCAPHPGPSKYIIRLRKGCIWEVGVWKRQINTKVGPWGCRRGHRHPGWQCPGVGLNLFLTWSGPSQESVGRASRAGWLVQNLIAVLWDCCGLIDSGHKGRASQWGALGCRQ